MPHAYARKVGSHGKEARQAKPGAKQARASYPVWSDATKEALARDSLRIMSEYPDVTRIESLRRAAARLPKDQRRPISDITHNQWVLPLWEQFAAEKDAMNESTQQAQAPASQAFVSPFAAEDSEEHVEPVSEAVATPEAAPKPHNPADNFKGKRGVRAGTKLVRWNDAERRKVAKGYLKLQADFPDMGKTELVRRSMQYNLPDNRQRAVTGYSTEKPWLEPFLALVTSEVEQEREIFARQEAERIEEEQREAIEREAAQKIEASAKTQIAEIEQTAAQLTELAAHEARAEALVDFRANVSIEELLGMVARKLVKALARPIVDAFREEMTAGLGEMIPALTPAQPQRGGPQTLKAVEVDRVRKPKIYIVGLIHQQHQDIEREFGSRCDLGFGANLDQGGISAGKASNAEYVVLMGDYVSHVVRDQVKKAAPGFVTLSGSVSTLKRALNNWLSSEGRLAA